MFVMAGRDVPEDWVPSADHARSICDRHFGVGADGFVVMKKLAAAKYEWSFFNSDGSFAAMCGNAARAAASFLGEAKWPVELKTGFGLVKLEALVPSEFRVEIDYSKKRLQELALAKPSSDSGAAIGTPVLIDTGVPHVVMETAVDVLSLKSGSVERSLAAPFRWPKEAGAAGANVTFFRRTGAKAIEAVTFERGVEDYTLSCGTGVLAAAVVASRALQAGQWSQEITVKNPGGVLRVDSKNFPSSLLLTGPAHTVFRTEFEFDV